MKIVVIGGTGLIGKKTVANLRQKGHEVLAASPSSGVNSVTGEGLAEALAGAQVVFDVANAPSWEDKAVMEFFEKSGRIFLHLQCDFLMSDGGIRHSVSGLRRNYNWTAFCNLFLALPGEKRSTGIYEAQ